MQPKNQLSETDICAKYITPAILKVGWDEQTQIRREVPFTDGKIIVKGRVHARGNKKRADYILYLKPNIPIAVVEAKDNSNSIGAGMQQGLGYAKALDAPFIFSSNGDGFIFHNKAAIDDEPIETELSNDEFPSPETLWAYYKRYKNILDEEAEIILQDYFVTRGGRSPRYYQQVAVNRTIEAIVKGQQRILLTMATGTGKTYTAFNIIYRLWKSGTKKRILFLADRTALIDQTRRGDFRHFGDKMTVIKKKVVTFEDNDGSRSERLI
jgi:type I restriction enzyme R subunit